MEKVTIIIPVHEFNDEIKKYLDIAINSVKTQKKVPNILIVYSNKIEKEIIENFNIDGITLLKNENKTDFQSQINFAVENINTEYFSILEFDDEYSSTYFNIVDEYINEKSEIDILLPIIVETNNEQNAIKLTNESVWSKQFVGENGELGYLNADSLNNYTDFKISGAIIKKETYSAIRGLKSNIELTFNYEFLLRLLNNGYIIFTMPKIGYKHLATRENSLFDIYNKKFSQNERNFWFKTAKNESNFINDRIIDTSNLEQK